MNPPIVYEVTKPRPQRTNRITAIVQSMCTFPNQVHRLFTLGWDRFACLIFVFTDRQRRIALRLGTLLQQLSGQFRDLSGFRYLQPR